MISGNNAAEQAVIGAILMAPDEVLPQAMAQLAPRDFQVPEYRNVFARCSELFDLQKPVDVVTALDGFDPAYRTLATECCAAAPTIRNFESYIELVEQNARRARAYEAVTELQTALLEGEALGDCQMLAAKSAEALQEKRHGGEYSARELFVRFYETKMQPRKYLKTGIRRLDELTYIDRGDYIIVGARPSTGKTALTLQLMLYMAREHNVVYFSLETSAEKLADRIMANFTATPLRQIKQGRVDDWGKIAGTFDVFKDLRLHVVEAAGWTVPQIRCKAAQLRAEVVFIDYLSLIGSEGKTQYERVTNISRSLHTMAQQSKLVVVALSQLNREAKGSEPDMSQLRESGQIEQDADVILLLQDTDPTRQNADRKLIIAKNKEGSTGYITLSFLGDYQRFCEYETRLGENG